MCVYWLQEKDKTGKTPLQLAAEAGHADAVAELVQCHASAAVAIPDHGELFSASVSFDHFWVRLVGYC